MRVHRARPGGSEFRVIRPGRAGWRCATNCDTWRG
ncbi:hypothetical protein ACVWXU_007177 [Streptomyces sp. TE33382]